MRNFLALYQIVGITKTYAMRPLIWLGACILGLGCAGLNNGSPSLRLRDSYESPFDKSGPTVLRDAQSFLRWVEDGTVHPEITGIDFRRMGSGLSLRNLNHETRVAEIRPFAEVQHALTQFPNLQMI